MRKRMKKVIGASSGFTLVELLVALAILAIVAASFVGLYTTGVFGIARAGTRSHGINLSQEQLERSIQTGTVSTDIDLTITLPDGEEFEVSGEIKEHTNEDVTLRTFIPVKQ